MGLGPACSIPNEVMITDRALFEWRIRLSLVPSSTSSPLGAQERGLFAWHCYRFSCIALGSSISSSSYSSVISRTMTVQVNGHSGNRPASMWEQQAASACPGPVPERTRESAPCLHPEHCSNRRVNGPPVLCGPANLGPRRWLPLTTTSCLKGVGGRQALGGHGGSVRRNRRVEEFSPLCTRWPRWQPRKVAYRDQHQPKTMVGSTGLEVRNHREFSSRARVIILVSKSVSPLFLLIFRVSASTSQASWRWVRAINFGYVGSGAMTSGRAATWSRWAWVSIMQCGVCLLPPGVPAQAGPLCRSNRA